MHSAQSSTNADPQVARTEEELSKLAQVAMRKAPDQRTRAAGSDFFAELPLPAVDPTLRPAAVNNTPVSTNRLSLGRRAMRAFPRFLLAACIGVAGTLAWQSYGEAAKQTIGGWALQLGRTSSLLLTNSSPGSEIAPEQPDRVATTATPSPELIEQLQAMLHDLRSLREDMEQLKANPENLRQDMEQLKAGQENLRKDMEQLKAGQERMASDIAKAAEQDSQRRISESLPQATATSARKPVPRPPQRPTIVPAVPAPSLSQAAQRPPTTPQSSSTPRPPMPLR